MAGGFSINPASNRQDQKPAAVKGRRSEQIFSGQEAQGLRRAEREILGSARTVRDRWGIWRREDRASRSQRDLRAWRATERENQRRMRLGAIASERRMTSPTGGKVHPADHLAKRRRQENRTSSCRREFSTGHASPCERARAASLGRVGPLKRAGASMPGKSAPGYLVGDRNGPGRR
jgi:hypothetical protein